MFEKVLQTKTKVNNYATFDTGRETLPFDVAGDVMTQTQVQNVIWITQPLSEHHYITADKDDTLNITRNNATATGTEVVQKPGKNYFQYVEDNCEAMI